MSLKRLASLGGSEAPIVSTQRVCERERERKSLEDLGPVFILRAAMRERERDRGRWRLSAATSTLLRTIRKLLRLEAGVLFFYDFSFFSFALSMT